MVGTICKHEHEAASLSRSPHEAMAEARLLEVRSAAASTNAGAQMHDHAALDSAVATSVAFVDF